MELMLWRPLEEFFLGLLGQSHAGQGVQGLMDEVVDLPLHLRTTHHTPALNAGREETAEMEVARAAGPDLMFQAGRQFKVSHTPVETDPLEISETTGYCDQTRLGVEPTGEIEASLSRVLHRTGRSGATIVTVGAEIKVVGSRRAEARTTSAKARARMKEQREARVTTRATRAKAKAARKEETATGVEATDADWCRRRCALIFFLCH